MDKDYRSDYEVRKATLKAMGGDETKDYRSVYEIDLEILKLTEEGFPRQTKQLEFELEDGTTEIINFYVDQN